MTDHTATPVEAFEQGFTFETYLNSMQTLKRHLKEQFEVTPLTDQVTADFAKTLAKHGQLKLLVITEDFCPDSVLNLSIVARLAQALPDLHLRIVRRKDYRDLADNYPAADGYNHIPTLIFMDGRGNELGIWHERSAAAQKFLNGFLAEHPQPEKFLASGDINPAFRKWAKIRLDVQKRAYCDGLWLETIKELIVLLG